MEEIKRPDIEKLKPIPPRLSGRSAIGSTGALGASDCQFESGRPDHLLFGGLFISGDCVNSAKIEIYSVIDPFIQAKKEFTTFKSLFQNIIKNNPRAGSLKPIDERPGHISRWPG